MSSWTMSMHGLRTVTNLEIRQRVRSRRWIAALIAWFVVIGGVTGLIILSVSKVLSFSETPPNAGPIAFGWITFFVLGMGLVIAPTFTATSINGDRAAGTLALLQATRLSAAEIAGGKLLAAWLTSAVFLVVALPFIGWSMVLGSISLWQVIACFAVVFLEVAVVCAIGLGWSAVISRTAGSTVLTYLSIVALVVLMPLVMALLSPFTRTMETIRVWGPNSALMAQYEVAVNDYWSKNPTGDGTGIPAPPIGQCEWSQVQEERYHPERIWWLLLPNPFVIVADAAPLPDSALNNLGKYVGDSGDPLAFLRYGVRTLGNTPALERDECLQLYGMSQAYDVEFDETGNVLRVTTSGGEPVPVTSPVKRTPVTVDNALWPYGFGFNLLIGGLFFWVAVRRLTIPYGVLPKGTRVA